MRLYTIHIFQRFYIITANQLRRIMSVRTSPIYSLFSETVTGASSIRAYGRQTDLIAESDDLIERMQAAKYCSIVADR